MNPLDMRFHLHGSAAEMVAAEKLATTCCCRTARGSTAMCGLTRIVNRIFHKPKIFRISKTPSRWYKH